MFWIGLPDPEFPGSVKPTFAAPRQEPKPGDQQWQRGTLNALKGPARGTQVAPIQWGRGDTQPPPPGALAGLQLKTGQARY